MAIEFPGMKTSLCDPVSGLDTRSKWCGLMDTAHTRPATLGAHQSVKRSYLRQLTGIRHKATCQPLQAACSRIPPPNGIKAISSVTKIFFCALIRKEHNFQQILIRNSMATTPRKAHTRSEVMDVLGRQVKKLRIESGFSQEFLTSQCGIFRTYLSRIENGSANPTITVIAALAAALNVQTAELLTE